MLFRVQFIVVYFIFLFYLTVVLLGTKKVKYFKPPPVTFLQKKEESKTFKIEFKPLSEKDKENLPLWLPLTRPTRLTGELDPKEYCDYFEMLPDVRYSYLPTFVSDQDITNNWLTAHGIKKHGVYCRLEVAPNAVDLCDSRVARIEWSLDSHDYRCVSKFPQILGGITGNEILVCDGTLIDRKTNEKHEHFFDVDKVDKFTDFSEKMLDSGEFRFACPQKVDILNNHMIEYKGFNGSPGIPFVSIRNRCASANTNDRTSEINWSTAECECKNNLKQLYELKSNPCSSCHTASQKNEYGLDLARPCINLGTYPDLYAAMVIPCGLSTMDINAGCERGVLQATTTKSPELLKYL
ncbi:per os infectivity factor pif-2 [Cotesia congregata filamentous virus 1]|uniref:Per os infectivity factor pif-2 n=1 Tax=Cotesia congregata filamentous virus 1 TaxID=3064291 RepID=A0ABC8QPR7_9VIRU|nr:per os infectivity factor pif-2 [Cotesia congregata filamentous virus 1]